MEPPLAEAVEDDTVMIAEFSFGALRGRASLSQDSCRCVCVCVSASVLILTGIKPASSAKLSL